jgi:hypothetical protein
MLLHDMHRDFTYTHTPSKTLYILPDCLQDGSGYSNAVYYNLLSSISVFKKLEV